jgi:hypothetical protein
MDEDNNDSNDPPMADLSDRKSSTMNSIYTTTTITKPDVGNII